MSWHWLGPLGGVLLLLLPPRAPPPAAGAPAAPAAPAPPPRLPPAALPRLAASRAARSSFRGATGRPWKIRGELTIAAVPGRASGTLITSMRKRAVLGSSIS